MAPQLSAASPSSDSAVECRVFERIACDVPTSIKPASGWGRGEADWSATIRNISQGGINLSVARRFERGAALAIELPGSPGEEAYTVLAKVVQITRDEDGWSLGCTFVSALSDDEIERLIRYRKPEPKQTIAEVHCCLEIRPGLLLNYVIRGLSLPEWPLLPGQPLTLRGGAGEESWSLNTIVSACRQRQGCWSLACQLETPLSTSTLLRLLSLSQA